MDDRGLRVEQIRLTFEAADRVIDLRARLHLVIVGVLVAAALGAVAAWFAGQMPALGLAAVLPACALGIAFQVRGLRQAAQAALQNGEGAAESLERLMVPGDDPHVDERASVSS